MGEVELRQFGCEPCYRLWWERVHVRKPVSHCRRCRIKYDALPRVKEYGVAEFVCECGHTFRGRGRVTTTCECYWCHTQCTVRRIIPGQTGIRRRTAHRHSCSECEDMATMRYLGSHLQSEESESGIFQLFFLLSHCHLGPFCN